MATNSLKNRLVDLEHEKNINIENLAAIGSDLVVKLHPNVGKLYGDLVGT